MPDTNARAAYGTLLQVGDGLSPEAFTTVGEAKDISPPGYEVDMLDATHQDSTGGWREVRPGLKRLTPISFDLHYVTTDTTQNYVAGLISLLIAGTKRNFRLVYTTGHSVTAEGYCSKFMPSAPVDGLLVASCEIALTSDPTHA